MKTLIPATFCMALACCVGTIGAADAVYRKSAETPVQGKITEITKTQVTVQKRVGGAESIPAGDVDHVRWEGEPPQLNLARTAEANGRLDKALESYQAIAKQIGSDNRFLDDDLQFLIARTIAKTAEGDATRMSEAVQKLEAFRTAHPDHFRFYECLLLLGRLHLIQGDPQRAESVFNELFQSTSPDLKLAAEIGRSRLLVRQGQFVPALEGFERVLAAPAATPVEQLRRYEALLGKATCLQNQQQYEPALAALAEVIDGLPGTNSTLQAEAYLRQGDALQASGRTKEALVAYLHVQMLFAREKAMYPEALFQLANLWGQLGKPERAADVRDELRSEYPQSDWTKKLEDAGDG